MNKNLPTSCKILTKKWKQKEQQMHKKKLREIKGQLDFNPPAQYNHLKSKNKRE